MKYECPECKNIFDDNGLFDDHDCVDTSQAQQLLEKPRTFISLMLGQDFQDTIDKLENERKTNEKA